MEQPTSKQFKCLLSTHLRVGIWSTSRAAVGSQTQMLEVLFRLTRTQKDTAHFPASRCLLSRVINYANDLCWACRSYSSHSNAAVARKCTGGGVHYRACSLGTLHTCSWEPWLENVQSLCWCSGGLKGPARYSLLTYTYWGTTSYPEYDNKAVFCSLVS